MKLCRLPAPDAYGRDYQCVFPGLTATLAAADGEIAAMENMTSDHYPLLSPRSPRYRVDVMKNPQGLGALEKLCWAADGKFYYNGEEKGELTLPGEKRFYSLNKWLVIWPDKLFYNIETDEFGPLEVSATADGDMWKAQFGSMTAPGGISSEANCLVVGGESLNGVFRAGEAVTITGCTRHPENNQTLFIRLAIVSEVAAMHPTPEVEQYPAVPLKRRIDFGVPVVNLPYEVHDPFSLMLREVEPGVFRDAVFRTFASVFALIPQNMLLRFLFVDEFDDQRHIRPEHSFHTVAIFLRLQSRQPDEVVSVKQQIPQVIRREDPVPHEVLCSKRNGFRDILYYI